MSQSTFDSSTIDYTDTVIPHSLHVSHNQGDYVELGVSDPTIDAGHLEFHLTVTECRALIDALGRRLAAVERERLEHPGFYGGLT